MKEWEASWAKLPTDGTESIYSGRAKPPIKMNIDPACNI